MQIVYPDFPEKLLNTHQNSDFTIKGLACIFKLNFKSPSSDIENSLNKSIMEISILPRTSLIHSG